MSRSIAPGQTVPVPFTLAETPDSLPTLTVYQSTADGGLFDLTAMASPTVVQLSGLAYHAYFTVPFPVIAPGDPIPSHHGFAYQLLVSVTIGGETTTHWLDGGTVERWASQASVDEVAASVDGVASEETLQKVLSKVNLLKSGLNVQYPFVSATGTIVLFEGFDFTDAGNAAIQITEAEVGQFDPTRMDIGSFQFYMRSQSSNDDYLGTATATKNADLWTLKAEIESEELPMKIGMYDWWFIATEVGTGDSDHFGIVHGTLELRRGMKVTC